MNAVPSCSLPRLTIPDKCFASVSIDLAMKVPPEPRLTKQGESGASTEPLGDEGD